MKYEIVIRHEPQTCIESEAGWWYEHCKIKAETDDNALKEAKSLCCRIGDECSQGSVKSFGYGCSHSVDELYRLDGAGRVSIYNDGVYQTVYWDHEGKHEVKRVTDGTIANFLRSRV